MEDFKELLQNPWTFLPIGYLFSVVIETTVLCASLSSQHPMARRVLCGLWLTACTYPIVVLVLPVYFRERIVYLAVAESVAHFGECLLFWLAFRPLTHFWRDMAAVFGANLASFGAGELTYYCMGMYTAAPDGMP